MPQRRQDAATSTEGLVFLGDVQQKVIHMMLVFTAVAVDGALKLRLQTTSFDSDRDLPTGADASRRQGNLEQVDAGGLLFFELGVSGGGLTVDRGDGARSLDLPAPLARDLTATYLNCAGDLIRPDGPDQPENTH